MASVSLPAEHIGTLSAVTTEAPRITVPDRPAGTRSSVTVSSARLDGPRIAASLHRWCPALRLVTG